MRNGILRDSHRDLRRVDATRAGREGGGVVANGAAEERAGAGGAVEGGGEDAGVPVGEAEELQPERDEGYRVPRHRPHNALRHDDLHTRTGLDPICAGITSRAHANRFPPYELEARLEGGDAHDVANARPRATQARARRRGPREGRRGRLGGPHDSGALRHGGGGRLCKGLARWRIRRGRGDGRGGGRRQRARVRGEGGNGGGDEEGDG